MFDWLAVGAAVGIEVLTPENVAAALLRKITGGTMDTSVNISNFDSRLSNTYLMAAESARGIIGGKFYSSFNEFCDWMSVVFGYVYCIEDIYDETRNEHSKAVCFRHRSELFNPYASISKFGESKNHKYSVDSSYIFSTVTVGYDKKDYESINGRDEFNFSNTYSTGCSLSDKTLSLISKYRADSYGIEFAVQKRGQDTTDSTSDKDVFFLLCTRPSGKLVPDRTAVIENTISDMVFNGAFSPMACVRANAGLIGMQDEELTLKFASSTGNSDIVIDDEPMKSDITLNTPLATCGVLEFETDKAYTENDESKMIKVSDGKFTYQGFLQEADTLYAHANTTKCKIIVKEVLSS